MFSFLNKKDSIPKQLSNIADHLPANYQQHRQMIAFREYIDANEWGLALESLIELTSETGHYFSDTFWTSLAACAIQMGMNDDASYCKQQIQRNNF